MIILRTIKILRWKERKLFVTNENRIKAIRERVTAKQLKRAQQKVIKTKKVPGERVSFRRISLNIIISSRIRMLYLSDKRFRGGRVGNKRYRSAWEERSVFFLSTDARWNYHSHRKQKQP